jgi:hypothetical protein
VWRPMPFNSPAALSAEADLVPRRKALSFTPASGYIFDFGVVTVNMTATLTLFQVGPR